MKIYLCRTENVTPALFFKLFNSLPIERRTYVERFKMESDRLERTIGFHLVRKILSDALPCFENPDWVISDNGKPFLPDIPYCFSLSHSDGICAAVISKNPIGCDIEKVHALRPALLKHFANDREISRSLGSPDFPVLLWTKKEAIGKADGIGNRQNMAALSTESTDSILLRFKNVSYWCSVFPGDGEIVPIFLDPNDLLI